MRDVSQVAHELELSRRRVRQLLERGLLAGKRVGGRWLVTGADLNAFRGRNRLIGRPWSSGAAWAVLAELVELNVPISAAQRSRARQRLAGGGIARLVPHLRGRAHSVHYYAHPAALKRLERDAVLVLASESAASRVGADLIAPADHLESYVRESDLDSLARRYALVADAGRPNLLLRVVPEGLWPFPDGLKVAPGVVVGVDLVESLDGRARRAGTVLLANV